MMPDGGGKMTAPGGGAQKKPLLTLGDVALNYGEIQKEKFREQRFRNRYPGSDCEGSLSAVIAREGKTWSCPIWGQSKRKGA